MNVRTFTCAMLLLFGFSAVFGLYLSFSPHMHHQAGCSFAVAGETALCANSALAHIALWQTTFTAAVAGVLLLFVLAALCIRREFFKRPSGWFRHPYIRKRAVGPPTLFQELFSQGILNPKAP